jgi:hypothetical protein
VSSRPVSSQVIRPDRIIAHQRRRRDLPAMAYIV